MNNKLVKYLIISFLSLLILVFVAMFVGVYKFENSIMDIIISFFSTNQSVPEIDRYVFLDLRLSRIVMAVLVGSALSVSGTCMQGMFKNPLATPDLIGITAGASLFAAIAIVLGEYIKPYIPEALHFSFLSIAAFVGALITMSIVYRISTSNGKTNVVMMLLSGVAVTALGFAVMGLLIYISKEEQLRDLTFWNLGSLGGASWIKNTVLFVVISVSYYFLINKGKVLNAMMLGEKDAVHLGIAVEQTKKKIIFFTALLVGTSVAFSGTIGFVGLIIPYILRLVFKSNYYLILPLSAVFGSILLLIADTLSRTIIEPSEVPIGILTAFMGAPIFIAILIKQKKSLQ
ncbi:MAG: iron ABC transporter permease [Bacteroidota bacterium]|nr:iron ABC transporter permease [Bacteroidota bacterium]